MTAALYAFLRLRHFTDAEWTMTSAKYLKIKPLVFEESENGSCRKNSERVRRLTPQIRYYREEGFDWTYIKYSLAAIGIRLAAQSLKNIVSQNPVKTSLAPFSKGFPCAIGLESSQRRSTNL